MSTAVPRPAVLSQSCPQQAGAHAVRPTSAAGRPSGRRRMGTGAPVRPRTGSDDGDRAHQLSARLQLWLRRREPIRGGDQRARQIQGYVDDALRYGNATRGGASIRYDLGRVIGLDQAGSPVTGIQIWACDGYIRTAYPVAP